MSETPEMDRLVDRLFNDPKRKTLNFHVSWGPDAADKTTEERARILNEAMDQVDSGEAKPLDFADSLREPMTIDEFLKVPQSRDGETP